MKLAKFFKVLRHLRADVLLLGLFDRLLAALLKKISALQAAVRRKTEARPAEEAVPETER